MCATARCRTIRRTLTALFCSHNARRKTIELKHYRHFITFFFISNARHYKNNIFLCNSWKYKKHVVNLSNLLKGLARAKIIKKSVILFWLLNMTIRCKHVHRLELQKFFNFSAAHSPVRLDIATKFLISNH